MGYRRTLLGRWSRRDWLTVAITALTTAFVVGAALLLVTAGAYTATLGADLSTAATVTYHDDPAAAVDRATGAAVVLPVADVTVGGAERTVVGVPPDAPGEIGDASVPWQAARLPSPGGRVSGPVDDPTRQRLVGTDRTVEVDVSPHGSGDSVLHDRWYVANASAVRTLGATGAFLVDPAAASAGSVPARGVPLLSALLFLLGGMREVVGVLSVAAGGAGLLVLVVVYSVTRMRVRDRRRTVRVARATGATPAAVLSLFGARALLLGAAGAGFGYAVGVVATKALVDGARYLGLPVSLEVSVTPDVLAVVGPALAVIVGAAGAGGLLAAWPATRCPPAALAGPRVATRDREGGGGARGRLRAALAPRLLDGRTVVPTATTLAVFAFVVLVAGGIAGALAPAGAAESGTITESGALHPLNSRVDADYAAVLRSEGLAASPEVVLAQVRDGRPYLARGANFSAFADVTGARVVAGRAPTAPDEAVVGRDLAAVLGLSVGDAVAVGGSVSPGVRRVRIVGVYASGGVYDHQLVVPLEAAWGLATPRGTVHLVRTSGDPGGGPGEERTGVAVTGLTAPASAARGESVAVRVDLRNFADERRTRRVTLRVGNDSRERAVAVPAGERERVTFDLRPAATGTRTLRVGTHARSIRIYDPEALRLPDEIPDSGPPGSSLVVPVVTPTGDPVPNATVRVGDVAVRTDARGVADLLLPEREGTYTVVASKGDRPTATTAVRVAAGAPRRFGARVRVGPASGTPLTRPTVNVTLANPWYDELTREVVVVTPAGRRTRTVTLGPEGRAAHEFELGSSDTKRFSPGTYEIRVLINESVVSTGRYVVRGDRHVSAGVRADGAYAPGTGVGRSIREVFGNLWVVLGAVVLLAGATTAGATTATFAQAVHRRRRTLGVYRATGADGRRLLALVLADVVRIAVPASVIAVALAAAAARLLAESGVLVAFGVRLGLGAPAWVLPAGVLLSIAIAAVGAVLAVAPAVYCSVSRLL
jgi:ABC-type antimicrobial peptide transport system permease subunit